MTRLHRYVLALSLSVLTAAGLAVAPAGAGGPGWGAPDLGTWSLGRSALVAAVACPIPGACVAVGTTTSEVFVVIQHGGRWSSPVVVARNLHQPTVTGLACPGRGSCAAGGYLAYPAPVAFVVTETGARWSLTDLPPLASAAGLGTSVAAVACSAPGTCVAVGAAGAPEANTGSVFTALETGGVWGPEEPIGTLSGDSGSPIAGVLAACVPNGPCTVAGEYTSTTLLDVNGDGFSEPFVDTETGGQWASPAALTGWSALNLSDYASSYDGEDLSPWPTSLACPASGDCTVVGTYGTAISSSLSGYSDFVVSERSGTWGAPAVIPSVAAADGGHNATATAVSCPTSSACTVGGLYTHRGAYYAYLVSETAGDFGALTSFPFPSWRTPGDTSHQSGGVFLTGLACAQPGSCAWWGTMGTQATGDLFPYDGIVSGPPGLGIVGTYQRGRLTYSRIVAPVGEKDTVYPSYLSSGACAPHSLACAAGGGWTWRMIPGTPSRPPITWGRFFVLALS